MNGQIKDFDGMRQPFRTFRKDPQPFLRESTFVYSFRIEEARRRRFKLPGSDTHKIFA